jgi:hypothetical protein
LLTLGEIIEDQQAEVIKTIDRSVEREFVPPLPGGGQTMARRKKELRLRACRTTRGERHESKRRQTAPPDLLITQNPA